MPNIEGYAQEDPNWAEKEKTHPTSVTTTKGGKELGRQIGMLRYDLVLDVVQGLYQEVKAQAEADHFKGRKRLGGALTDLYRAIWQLRSPLEAVINICKPWIAREREREMAEAAIRVPKLKVGSIQARSIPTGSIPDDRIVSPWRPDASPKQARRIGKCQEEVAELSKVLARISIQGLHSVNPTTHKTNFKELMEEMADVGAQFELIVEEMGLDVLFLRARAEHKKKLMASWEAHFPEQQ